MAQHSLAKFASGLGSVGLLSASLCLAAGSTLAQSTKDELRDEQAAEAETVLPEFIFPGRELTFYGQLSPSIFAYDDGFQNQTALADNANSPSRIGIFFDWDARLFGATRFNVEVGVGFRQSASISQSTLPDTWTFNQRSLRKLEIISQHDWGTISLGQGSMSTDGVAEKDQSGTGIVATSSVGDTAGGLFFRRSDGVLSPVLVAGVFRNLDGFRSVRLRYDTPRRNYWRASISIGSEVLFDQLTDDTLELAADYVNDGDILKILGSFGVALVRNSDDSNDARTIGSASVLHKPSGVNLQASAGYSSEGARYIYGKLGWRRDFERFGQTFLSVDAYHGQNTALSGGESTSYGLSAVQNVKRLNGEVYSSLRRYHYRNESGIQYEPITSVIAGVRWRF